MADRDLRGRTLGDFVLLELLGEGGFGAVWRCAQPSLKRDVVVKVLHERRRSNNVAQERFLRQAQLASRLDHPYAVHIYDFGVEKDDGLRWIAMELVQGITLDEWLCERGPMPLEQFVPFFECVAEVVQAAHERGIVHRDLKPSNVMVIARGGRLLPKLLDFGIAKVKHEVAPRRTVAIVRRRLRSCWRVRCSPGWPSKRDWRARSGACGRRRSRRMASRSSRPTTRTPRYGTRGPTGCCSPSLMATPFIRPCTATTAQGSSLEVATVLSGSGTRAAACSCASCGATARSHATTLSRFPPTTSSLPRSTRMGL